jgi:flavin-dependent dehydrogenase
MELRSWFLIALAGAMSGVSAAAQTERADVVVVAAMPAGVAVAVAAARSGASVILVEEGQHVGEIVSGGSTNTDIRKHAAVGGLYNEFKRLVREHYVRSYGADSDPVRLSRDGNRFKPKVAEAVFRELLANEDRIRLVLRHRRVAARVAVAANADGIDRAERDATTGRRIDGASPKDFGPTAKRRSL